MGSCCSCCSRRKKKSVPVNTTKKSLECTKEETEAISEGPSTFVSRNKCPLLITGYIHNYDFDILLSVSVLKIILDYYYIPKQKNIAKNLYDLHINEWIDAKDYWNNWLPAIIEDEGHDDQFRDYIYVHFKGWSYWWDEWIRYDISRICNCNEFNLNKCCVDDHRISIFGTQQTLKQYTIYGVPKYKNIVGLCPNYHRWINPIQIYYSLKLQLS